MEKPSRINRRKCIETDGKCMWCGAVNGLEPHHIIHKSQGGKDYLWNLITLCHNCHMTLHHGLPNGTIRIPEIVLIIKILESYSSLKKIFRWGKALEILRKKSKGREDEFRSFSFSTKKCD